MVRGQAVGPIERSRPPGEGPEQLAKVTESDLLRLDFVVQAGDLCLPLPE